MKKWIIGILSFLVLIAIIAYMIIPGKVLEMIMVYEPFTFEKVLSDSKMRTDYGILDNEKPEDYQFTSEEITYKTYDGLNLNGWWIESKIETDSCFVLIHGRTSNRLKTMKYLSLIDSLDLDTLYNIFIPDLRNSGKSDPSETAMGYYFGGDVVATLEMLNSNYQQNHFLLYGFSMGAMAVSNAVGRPDLQTKLAARNLVVDRIILDSPLSNVKNTLNVEAEKMPIVQPLFAKVFEMYSEKINGFGDDMKLSSLLPQNIPTLILQSEDDHTTLMDVLQKELDLMAGHKNLSLRIFNGPDHVRMFQDSRTRVDYIQAVSDFMCSE